MSQDIFSDINPSVTSGTELANDILNPFKDAIVSGFSGTSRPANLQAGGNWVDTTLDPNFWELKVYDGTQDIVLMTLNLSTGTASVTTSDELLTILKESDDVVPPVLQFLKSRTGAGQTLENDELGRIKFTGKDSGGTEVDQAFIKNVTSDDTSSSEKGSYFTFELAAQDSSSITELMRLIDDKVGIRETNPDVTLHVKGDGIKHEILGDNTNPSFLFLEKKRASTNGQVLSGDSVGKIEIQSTDQNGTTFEAASISSSASENHTDTARGTALSISTIEPGATSSTEKISVTDQVTVTGTLECNTLIVDSLSSEGNLTAANTSDTTDSPTLILDKQRSTGNGQVLQNDGAGKVESRSTDINGDEFEASAIETFATENHTAAARGSKIRFSTISSGSTTLSNRMEIDENITISNDLIVGGNLTVNGSTTTVNTSTLDVEDSNITVNKGGNQSTANTNDAGLTVEMSDATNAVVGYDSTTTTKFKVGESGSEVEIADVSSAQDISNKAIIDPSKLDVKKDTEANLTTYASSASDGQLCFATDTQQMFQVIDNELAAVGGGGIGTVDTVGIETYESTKASDLSSGNNSFFLNGGTLVGTLADEEASPLSGDRSLKYTQATGSANDSFEMATFTIQPKEQDRFAKIKFSGKYGGNDGDIRFVGEDNGGDDTLLGTSFVVENSTKVEPYEVFLVIPSGATSVTLGAFVDVENNGAVFEWDDIELTLDTHSEEAIKDIQEYKLTQVQNNMTDRTGEVQFDLGTVTETSNGEELIKAVDDSANNRTKFVAQAKCRVYGNWGVSPNQNDYAAYSKNGTWYASGSHNDGSVTRHQTVAIAIELDAGEFFTVGAADGVGDNIAGVVAGVANVASLTFTAEALSDHVVTSARSNLTGWQSYTPMTQGLGSATIDYAQYRRVGDTVEIQAQITAGTVTADEMQIGLPDNTTCHADYSTNYIGEGHKQSGTDADYSLLATANDSFLNVGFRDGSINNILTPQNGSTILSNSDTFVFNASVKVNEYSSESQFLAALPKLEVSNTRENILSADVTTNGDIADLQFDNLVVGNTYILTGVLYSRDASSGVGNIIKAYSGASATGTVYGKLHQNSATNTQVLTTNASIVFTADSTSLYINGSDIGQIRGNGTKNETFLQLTDVTSEFIKAQPKNRYGEKILSADVASNGDIADLQFNNLEVGKFYELKGTVVLRGNNGYIESILRAYSAPSAAGTLYGTISAGGQTSSVTSFNGSGVSIVFQATSSTVYINVSNTDVIFGNGTKEKTFLQLEERRDLEETTNFD